MMTRIWHHFDLWEDYHHGMYDEDREGRQERVLRAAEILGDPILCERAMRQVVTEWRFACEFNLSNAEINRRAWLGQAACSCYGGVHEDETREAWGLLSNEQRVQANNIATKIIKQWLTENDPAVNRQISMF
jgi:hypothetical protein